jgi:hypothetical protein
MENHMEAVGQATLGGSTTSWAKLAIATGLCAVASYFCSVVFKPLPWTVGRFLFFAVGPLSVVSAVGFYKSTRSGAGGIAHTLGSLFLVIAGVVMNLMAVIQDTQFTVLGKRIRQAQDESVRELIKEVLSGVNVVQSGLDVSWDIFISIGTILLAVSLMRHPAFGRLWGVVGAAISAAALVLNLITFPTAPAAAGLVDLGPGVGLWYLVTLLLLLKNVSRIPG